MFDFGFFSSIRQSSIVITYNPASQMIKTTEWFHLLGFLFVSFVDLR
jgi:hypothetical protein